MTMNHAKTGKARMAILAGTLALSMCPVSAFAQTTHQAADASEERPSFAQGDEQRPADEGWGGEQRPQGPQQGDMPSMQFDFGMPMFDGEQTPRGELPTGELPTGELPTGELPSGELPTGEAPTADGQTMPFEGTPSTDGQRPELPTNMNGDDANRPSAPTSTDGTQQQQPPAKPEGDLAPELPEGEEPKLTGERPELPTNTDAKTDASTNANTNANADASAKPNTTGARKDNDRNDDGTRTMQAGSFMDRMADFFRRIFDFCSGTGR